MVLQLVIIAGNDKDKGRVFPLPEQGTFQIGRGPTTDTRLNDRTCSRTHCQVRVESERAVITDANSQVGTFVNDQRISEHQLSPGDIIRVGDTQMRLEEEDVALAKTVGNINHMMDAAAPAAREALGELVGTTLAHYKIGPVLAQGESSVIFRARDARSDQEVALKVLRPEYCKSEAETSRFLRAVEPLLALRHPNLVALYETGKTGPHCWVAMEYVEGENLAQLIQRAGMAGMLDWQHALRIALHMGRALDFLHQHRIIHRNILPRAILMNTRDPLTKLGSLTGARTLEASRAEPPMPVEAVLRHLAYAPPEVARRGAPGDARADIYSLGAALYTVLTGRPPFEGKTTPEIIAKVLQAEPIRPKEFQLLLPDSFERTLLRMMAKRPEDRYQTAAELLTDLERGTAPQASGPGTPAVSSPQANGKISVTCGCGQALQARAKYAGTRVRCPACGVLLLLPGKAAPTQFTTAARMPALEGGETPKAKPRAWLLRLFTWVLVGTLLGVAGIAYLPGLFQTPDRPPTKDQPSGKDASEQGTTSPSPGGPLQKEAANK